MRTFQRLLYFCCKDYNSAYLLASDTHEETTAFESYGETATSSEHTSNSHYSGNPANRLMDISGDSYDVTCTVSEDRSYGTILCRNEVHEKWTHPT